MKTKDGGCMKKKGIISICARGRMQAGRSSTLKSTRNWQGWFGCDDEGQCVPAHFVWRAVAKSRGIGCFVAVHVATSGSGRLRESYSPLCPLDISPKCDGGAVEFGGELTIEIYLNTEHVSKILISKATVPPQFRRVLRRNWGG